jgi:indole-3-glycerol phosphate synthase
MKETILEKIIEAKRPRVEAAKRNSDLQHTEPRGRPHRFRDALSDRSRANIIAEFKRASPSKGWINNSREPAEAAAAYRDGGAAAISVLTEEDFFKGSLDDLRAVRERVDLPLLRKDFIIDEFQIRESAAAGADAILLIVSALSIDDLRQFQSIAHELGLDALVEVHDRDELDTAIDMGATLIGVNNRNLKTFEVSLDVCRELVGYAPDDALMIAESGIKTRDEVDELRALGYSAFLIGEILMRADGDKTNLEQLIGAGG